MILLARDLELEFSRTRVVLNLVVEDAMRKICCIVSTFMKAKPLPAFLTRVIVRMILSKKYSTRHTTIEAAKRT